MYPQTETKKKRKERKGKGREGKGRKEKKKEAKEKGRKEREQETAVKGTRSKLNCNIRSNHLCLLLVRGLRCTTPHLISDFSL